MSKVINPMNSLLRQIHIEYFNEISLVQFQEKFDGQTKMHNWLINRVASAQYNSIKKILGEIKKEIKRDEQSGFEDLVLNYFKNDIFGDKYE